MSKSFDRYAFLEKGILPKSNGQLLRETLFPNISSERWEQLSPSERRYFEDSAREFLSKANQGKR
jgi:hypothetical protein